jgi:hypothetical protein
MPVHIDRMDTSVEILPGESSPGRGGDARGGGSDPASRTALRDTVVQLLEEELDSFLRIRGA